jgi:predicted RNA-binding Zn-ribbon protein involved in translation (DUF1610 family)
MKKLQSRDKGWRVHNPPQTERERLLATVAGFVELASSEWILPEPDFRPSLAAIRKYAYGHRCHACHSSFRSQKPRDPYCPSCDNIMAQRRQELESILQRALRQPAEEQRKAWEAIEEQLTCPNCGWQGNKNRLEPQEITMLLDYLPGWVERAYLHFMHHVFWNRFKYSR